MPKGVKAEMVEQQLKGVTADPANATKEQKAEAEETVEKELRDQMVLDVLSEKLDVKVSQADVFNFLASIAQQYGMDPNAFIQAIIEWPALAPLCRKSGRSKGLLAGMRPSPSTLMAKLWTSPPSWAKPLKTKKPRALKPLPLLPPWPTNLLPKSELRSIASDAEFAIS